MGARGRIFCQATDASLWIDRLTPRAVALASNNRDIVGVVEVVHAQADEFAGSHAGVDQ